MFSLWTLLALLGASAASAEPTAADRPQLGLLRQDEDWGAFTDPNLHTRPLDPLKAIPLGPTGSLTLGGQARAVYSLFTNPDFGALPSDPNGVAHLRAMGFADLRLGAHVRGFVQVNSATQLSGPEDPLALDVNLLHLQQGFIELSSRASSQPPTIALRLGREEWHLGNGMMVDVRDGPNVRRAFDGAHLEVRTDRARGEVLFGAEVLPQAAVFDDMPTADNLLWGSYWEVNSPRIEQATGSLFYLGATRSEIAYLEDSGSELRHSVGARLHGRWAGLDYDASAFYQAGTFDGDSAGTLSISGWGLAGHLGWSPGLPLNLGGALDAGVSSGDVAAGDGRLGTFRAPFPETQELGAVTFLAPSNTMGFNTGLSASPAPGVFISGVTRYLWRMRLSDAIYAVPGYPLRESESDERFIGVGAGGAVFWSFSPGGSLALFGDFFRPGAFIESAPPAEDSWLIASASTLRF